METKRRGRPPGTIKKVNIEENLKAGLDVEPKKRGRKPKPQTESVAFVAEVPLEDEIEGTTSEKLKNIAKQLRYMEYILDQEPYRIDIRLKKGETISRMCFLIDTL